MRCRNMLRNLTRLVLLTGLIGHIGVLCDVTCGHENHAPLPTKGVKIAGDTIMLSDKAREAIGLTTAKIEFGDIHRVVTVNARVEIPWNSQTMITSLVPGKIAHVLVRPGEVVVPGQELARVVSGELESLQLTLLQARAEAALAARLFDQRSTLEQQGVIAGKTFLEAQATLDEQDGGIGDGASEALGHRLRRGHDSEGGRVRQAARVRVHHQSARWRHHARRRADRPTGQSHGSPLSRRGSIQTLDCRRRAGVRCAFPEKGTIHRSHVCRAPGHQVHGPDRPFAD